MCEKGSVCVSLLDMLPVPQSWVPATSLAKNIQFTSLVEGDTTSSYKLRLLCVQDHLYLRDLISDLSLKKPFLFFFLSIKLLTSNK